MANDTCKTQRKHCNEQRIEKKPTNTQKPTIWKCDVCCNAVIHCDSHTSSRVARVMPNVGSKTMACSIGIGSVRDSKKRWTTTVSNPFDVDARVSKALACAVGVVAVCSNVLFFSTWATDKIARKSTIYRCVRWVRCNCLRILFTRVWDRAATAAYTTITLINISIVNSSVYCRSKCNYLPATSVFSIVCLPACLPDWLTDGRTGCLTIWLFGWFCLRSACVRVWACVYWWA